MSGEEPQVTHFDPGVGEIPVLPVSHVKMSQQTSVRLFLSPDLQAEFSIENWPANLRLPVEGEKLAFDDVLYEIIDVEFTVSKHVNLVDLYGVVLVDYTEEDESDE